MGLAQSLQQVMQQGPTNTNNNTDISSSASNVTSSALHSHAVLTALQRLRAAGSKGLSLSALLSDDDTETGPDISAPLPHTQQALPPLPSSQQQPQQQQQTQQQPQQQLQQTQQTQHPPTRLSALTAACLLRCGLARALPSYSSVRLLAAECSQKVVVRVPSSCLMQGSNQMLQQHTAHHQQALLQQQHDQQQAQTQQQQRQDQHQMLTSQQQDQQQQQSNKAMDVDGAALSAGEGADSVEVPQAPWMDGAGWVNVDFLQVRRVDDEDE